MSVSVEKVLNSPELYVLFLFVVLQLLDSCYVRHTITGISCYIV